MAHPPSPGIADHPEGLQEIISRRLMHAIIDGGLPSGEKLSPTKLASEFGVSHIPVREALAALEAAGYVRRAPRVGFFVAELPTDDVEGVYHWRQVLEDEAHRIAVPRLEDSDLARMRKLNDSIDRSASRRTASSISTVNSISSLSGRRGARSSSASSISCGTRRRDIRRRWTWPAFPGRSYASTKPL